MSDRLIQFKEKDVLGRGGFGTVYSGQYGLAGAAIKRIPRFSVWNELEILKNMPINTNVIRAFGFEYEASHVFVAMELCERSLADEIFIQDGIGPLALCRLIESLKDGFKCLVENNIVHGDLKPDNILVVNNVYKLADFGLSSFAKINERVKLATGTFPYAHPDVFKSTYWEKIGLEKQPNATFPRQIDLYSMGVTIFEAITGKLPFNASNTQSMYKLIAEKPKTAVRGTEVHGGFYYYDEMAKCTLRPFQKFKMTQLLVKLLQHEEHRMLRFEEFFEAAQNYLNISNL